MFVKHSSQTHLFIIHLAIINKSPNEAGWLSVVQVRLDQEKLHLTLYECHANAVSLFYCFTLELLELGTRATKQEDEDNSGFV